MPYHALCYEPSFFEFLLNIDRDIADKVHATPCPLCGGQLDRADFYRSEGFGMPPADTAELLRRFSFTCRNCRKRCTPPSVRFLPFKCYGTIIIVLLSQTTPNEHRKRLQEFLGINRQTIARWKRWWCDVFKDSGFWRGLKGFFLSLLSLPDELLPEELLHYFAKTLGSLRDTITATCGLIGSWRWSNPFGVFRIIGSHFERKEFAQTWCGDH